MMVCNAEQGSAGMVRDFSLSDKQTQTQITHQKAFGESSTLASLSAFFDNSRPV
jgi:hypothetical protein